MRRHFNTVRTHIAVEASLLFMTVRRLTHDSEEQWVDGRLVLDPSPIMLALLDMAPGPDAAACFHESIGRATVNAAVTLASARSLGTDAHPLLRSLLLAHRMIEPELGRMEHQPWRGQSVAVPGIPGDRRALGGQLGPRLVRPTGLES